MQTMKYLAQWLQQHANHERYLFTFHDLRCLFPSMPGASYKTLLSRAASTGPLQRLCRGLYIYPPAMPRTGLLLFHAAARLRADRLNYISLETVLSDAGVISQIPMNWITLMSSGRSLIVPCGEFGTIEFVHTRQKPKNLTKQLFYDDRCHLWRATVPQALRDMKVTHRNMDLIDWSVADEFI